MQYFKDRGNAFVHALRGLAAAFRSEPHIKIHAAALVIVAATAVYFGVGPGEWLAIAGCSVLVLITELFNTAIEKLCDVVHPGIHPTIKYIKDISAAAVLLACVFSLVVGAVIFVPHLLTD